MNTHTRTPKIPWAEIRSLKARVAASGLTYRQIGRKCNPVVTRNMVEKVINGWRLSQNVMAALNLNCPPHQRPNGEGDGT